MHIYYTRRHLLHNPAGVLVDGRPFSSEDGPERIELIRDALQSVCLGSFFEPADFSLDPIRRVHDPGYLDFLQNVFEANKKVQGQALPVIPETFAPRGSRRRPQNPIFQKGYYAFGVGSPILEETWQAAYWSAQCACSAAESIRQGGRVSYALCRPPGHHAGPDMYGGFCYLNNAAIAAGFLIDEPGGWNANRVAILDIDYHHGNGTQEIFYRDPRVLYCSLHAHPDLDYPYFWGAADETGVPPAVGLNRNWPLPLNVSDEDYLPVLDKALLAIRSFKPQALVVSVGFDIVQGDPAGGFRITSTCLGHIGARIKELNLPTILIQEGGYLLETIGENAVAFLSAFRQFSPG